MTAPGGRGDAPRDRDAPAPARPVRLFPDLGVRVVSAVVLMAIALIDFWQGGVWVTALVSLGTGLMIWEYRRMIRPGQRLRDPSLWVMVAAGVGGVIVTGFYGLLAGAGALLAGAAVVAATTSRRRIWMILGLLYIALAMATLVELRRDPVQGFPLVLWLVLIVIATDAGAYFAGRRIGGPKLWPRVSPNKTWAGAIGGLLCALAVGAGFHGAGGVALPWLVLLSGALALAAQAGDLAESWFKRRFGVKDASALIPGHGGVLDRLDGLLGALWAYFALSLSGILAG